MAWRFLILAGNDVPFRHTPREVKKALAKEGKSSADIVKQREKRLAEARLLEKKELEMQKFAAEKVVFLELSMHSLAECRGTSWEHVYTPLLVNCVVYTRFKNLAMPCHGCFKLHGASHAHCNARSIDDLITNQSLQQYW
jgi:hypothetical protein